MTPFKKDDSGSREMTTNELLLKVYHKINDTDQRLTASVHEIFTKVVVLAARFDNFELISGKTMALLISQHKEMCRKELKKSGAKIRNPSIPPAAIDSFKNPYTISAVVVAVASTITAIVQYLD